MKSSSMGSSSKASLHSGVTMLEQGEQGEF